MESDRIKWIQKYSSRALDYWRHHEHTLDVSENYRICLESDLAKHYDDPLKREFVEKLWVL